MSRDLTADEAKKEIVRLVNGGSSIAQALLVVDKHRNTYEYYRKTDPSFVIEIEKAKTLVKRGKGHIPQVEVPDFPEFSEKYLGQKLFYHQLQWYDMLEGREPRDLHPSMEYVGGRETRLIVNTPPGHAKSTTVTVNYVVWRIVKDPNVKVIIVSKTQELAKQFLLQIKERLTSDEYNQLQMDFAPAGGWKEGSASWTATAFYVNGRNAEAKDPTVRAIGIRAQIYGSRSDLIIIDDAVDNLNVNDYPKQIDWLTGMVASRLAPRTGRILIVGTRIAAKDMYSELRNPDNYSGSKLIWSYLKQPAVLEYAEDVKDWKTLWPLSDNPSDSDDEPNADGLYDRWTGETLDDIRGSMSPAQWSRMYMQEQVAEDSLFKMEVVKSSIQARVAGIIPDNKSLGREGGMSGLRIIAGLDPAAAGFTAMVVYGVDIRTKHRYVIDVWNKASARPDDIRNQIKDFTVKYNIKEWRIEANAFQSFLTYDTEINEWLSARGTILTPHYTGQNKHDPDFGVQAMSSLFDNYLIHLPSDKTENIRTLIDQLVVWQPGMSKKIKTDIVMALWFAEIRALELVQREERSNAYRDTPFTTRANKASRYIERNSLFGDKE